MMQKDSYFDNNDRCKIEYSQEENCLVIKLETKNHLIEFYSPDNRYITGVTFRGKGEEEWLPLCSLFDFLPYIDNYYPAKSDWEKLKWKDLEEALDKSWKLDHEPPDEFWNMC